MLIPQGVTTGTALLAFILFLKKEILKNWVTYLEIDLDRSSGDRFNSFSVLFYLCLLGAFEFFEAIVKGDCSCPACSSRLNEELYCLCITL